MKNELKRSERYFAIIEFENGKTASCRTGNLRKLLARISRGFAGEITDWGWIATSPVVAYRVEDQWSNGEHASCVVASKERE